jgi:formate dehydrogenase maturation protein FdhE
MEEILNKIIEIDNKAKAIVYDEKEKKNNIEEFIESEFNTKKTVLDLEFKDSINKEKEKYDKLLQEKKIESDNLLRSQIEELEKKYRESEEEIIKNILSSIIKGED